MRIPLIVVSVAVLSAACRPASLDEARQNAQEVIDSARTRADELRTLSTEELREFWAIEYKSLEIAQSDLASADKLLNEFGRERWECYHVSDTERGRVFYFKRNNSHLTAYLTNLLRIGAIAL